MFGILRPGLLLPDAETSDAVIAHELAHIRRHDNLWSSLHMVVEAFFWFHPLVWFLGARLLEDRERASDESALDAGCDAHGYAETLLESCRRHLAGRSVFLSCAGGSDLKRRIAGIMTHRLLRRLNPLQTAVLAAAAAVVVVTPIAAGWAVHAATAQEATSGPPPKFDVASIKPNDPKDPFIGPRVSPGRMSIHKLSLKRLILIAYRLKDFQLDGIRGWMDTDAWDIEATYTPTPGAAGSTGGFARLPALLEDRFHVVVHREMRQMPVYSLVVAKGGPKLVRSNPDDRKKQMYRQLPPNADPTGLSAIKWPFSAFVDALGGALNLPVVDKTGIAGDYDFDLRYTPQHLLEAPDYSPKSVSIFTAIQEQLGLKLEEAKGPVEVLVVVHAEKPTVN